MSRSELFTAKNMVRKGNQKVEEREANPSPQKSWMDVGSEISRGALAAWSSGDGGSKRAQWGSASPTFPCGQRVGAELDVVPRKALVKAGGTKCWDADGGMLPVYLSLLDARIGAALAATVHALLPGVSWGCPQLRLAPSPAKTPAPR